MSLSWFRFHADALNNKRVQKLSPSLFKLWVNCQCILTMEDVGASGKLPDIDDCAYFLRMSVEETVNNFEKLVEAGVFLKRNETFMKQNETESETKKSVSCVKNETLFETQSYRYFIKNWAKKQYKSDTSTDRVKRFRDKKKTVSETPPEQSRADTEQIQKERRKKKTKKDEDLFTFTFSEEAFDGTVIKLDANAFNVWFQEYSFNGDEVKFRALIKKRDNWYATVPYASHKNWLNDTTKWLLKSKQDRA